MVLHKAHERENSSLCLGRVVTYVVHGKAYEKIRQLQMTASLDYLLVSE